MNLMTSLIQLTTTRQLMRSQELNGFTSSFLCDALDIEDKHGAPNSISGIAIANTDCDYKQDDLAETTCRDLEIYDI